MLNTIAYGLMFIGGINWGLIGLSHFFGGGNWNIVNIVFGGMSGVEPVIYILVGLSTLMLAMRGRRSSTMGGQMM